MKYGYARCSTNETKQDITRQTRELKAKGVDDANIYLEYESGTKLDRRELKRLMDKVEAGDIIIATEVSRITRSTKQLCEIIEFAKDKKIKLVLDDFVVDCTKKLDAMTEGMLKMIGVFAELERNMIAERVRSGMNNAKAKGKIIGRPKLTKDDIPKSIIKHYDLYKNKHITKTQFADMVKTSRPSLDKYLKLLESR